jgi:hypothetical protein
MYGGVASIDSEVVFSGLALDDGWRSLANGLSSNRWTFVMSPDPTTALSRRSVIGRVLDDARLLHFSESRRTHSSNRRSPLRYFALTANSDQGEG